MVVYSNAAIICKTFPANSFVDLPRVPVGCGASDALEAWPSASSNRLFSVTQYSAMARHLPHTCNYFNDIILDEDLPDPMRKQWAEMPIKLRATTLEQPANSSKLYITDGSIGPYCPFYYYEARVHALLQGDSR